VEKKEYVRVRIAIRFFTPHKGNAFKLKRKRLLQNLVEAVHPELVEG
jgi:hypothetical protein